MPMPGLYRNQHHPLQIQTKFFWATIANSSVEMDETEEERKKLTSCFNGISEALREWTYVIHIDLQWRRNTRFAQIPIQRRTVIVQ